MSCIGPMVRTAEDLGLVYGIIAGPDGRDTDVPPVPVEAVSEPDLATLRIAVAPTFPGIPIAAAIRNAVEVLARQLGPSCAVVDEAELPALAFDQELLGMMIGAFQPEAAEAPATLARYLEALGRRDRCIIAWERFFEEWNVLLCPPSLTPAFPHREPGSAIPVDGRDVDYWQVGAHAAVFNYTGHPAVVLPSGRDRDGMPIGVQIVGKRWGDSRLLGIARALATVTGGFSRPPGFEPRTTTAPRRAAGDTSS